MSDSDQDGLLSTGAIAWMAKNPVAANLLMLILLIGGLMTVPTLKQEVFPEFTLDVISVSVPYPGASPQEVEQGIVLAVEEAVRGIDGVKRVSSVSSEGAGSVNAEILIDADPDRVLADIKTAVDRIRTFPLDAEEPSVTIVSRKQPVVSIILAADVELQALQAIAEGARAQLLESPDVTQADIMGVRPLEISIEVPQATLESLGLTLEQIALQVRSSSLELPGGSLKTEGGELLVRVSDRRRTGHEFEDLIVRSTLDGSEVRLGDIATVTDGYADTDLAYTLNGRPAVRIQAYRVGSETPAAVADATRDLADSLSADLPETVEVVVWDDDSVLLDERIDLLVRNAAMGLVLVLGVLASFLELRLALWVALGIPISFLGTMLVLPATGISINMISLFAFIVTLGMVVDDAIIVGENIHEHTKRGKSFMQAAIDGARQMSVPVTFSILTTIAAFAPMLTVPGVSGKLFRILPIIVICVLTFSLLESFFVLPAHLAHDIRVPQLLQRLSAPVLRPVRAFQGLVTRGLATFTDQFYRPALLVALRYRYVTAAAGLALFLVTIGLLSSGTVAFSFFPKLEGNLVTVSARLPYGVAMARTETVRDEIEAAGWRAIESVDGRPAVTGMFALVGSGPAAGGPGGGTRASGGHLVTVELELVPGPQRDFTAAQLTDLWQAEMPNLAGLEAISFSSSVGPAAGAAVDVQLAHSDTDVLEAASGEMTDILRSFPALKNVNNGYAAGKPQLDFTLKPMAKTLGLTSNDIARQLRSSFYGAEAIREQRDRNELKVMVRLPEAQRTSEYDLERLRIRTPAGGFVPLGAVAALSRGQAPTSIQRESGVRKVNVSAELGPGQQSAQEVLSILQAETFAELGAKYPGLTVELAGQQREQSETNAALGRSFILALFVMYTLLAVPFKSYVQPAVVMAAIPMGFAGAVFGHLLMGYPLSIISMFGVVALSGVVINDSLVLIDATNEQRRSHGASALDAIVWGGTRRLRPILLTSLTTFFGLAPMIAEQSVQAKFLIPMAISLGFGVLFATGIILVLVPALYLVVEDAVGLFSWLVGLMDDTPSDPEDSVEDDAAAAK